MKAVILAGGYGTRLAEESGIRPKPLVEIAHATIKINNLSIACLLDIAPTSGRTHHLTPYPRPPASLLDTIDHHYRVDDNVSLLGQ